MSGGMIERGLMSDELWQYLLDHYPLRIVMKKDEDGNLLGYCENSFSMSFEKARVRIWWSGTAYSNFGSTHEIDGIGDATHNSKEGDLILDPLDKDCPVDIDWNSWLNATGKYDRRNARFKMKENANV